MGRGLGNFQHSVARRIIGRQPKEHVDGGWDFPPMDTAMEEACFEEIGAYVLKRQNMVAQYITVWLILDLCEETVQRSRACVSSRWW